MPTPGGLRPARTPALPLPVVARIAGADPAGLPAVPVTGVTLDSRSVRPGDLYAALPGFHRHGAGFSAEAARAGAVAVLTDPPGATASAAAGLPVVVVVDPRAVLGAVAARVYGSPADDLLMLGVTGTNGKTTTAYLLEAGLRAEGRMSGLIGTVETRLGDDRLDSVRTTPEATELQALLAVMREHGCVACAMEVSSHALALHRVDGVVYDVAGFTNLSQDHLDFHADEEDYFAAKASLFTPERSRRAVVCVDDEWGRRLARQAGVPVVTLLTADARSAETVGGQAIPTAEVTPDWVVTERRTVQDGAATDFLLSGRDGAALSLRSPLPGEFNVANTALAALMLLEAGLTVDGLAAGLSRAVVPGRMQRVPGPAGGPLGVVDYAHTPEAVAAALRALRPGTVGRLVVVLGAGGERDVAKRPLMGAAAARGADVVIVTDDNPRSEDPAAIRAHVLAGAVDADTAAVVVEVGDRRAAVQLALTYATGPQDTVLVAGKGHERGQDVGGTVLPFDDREVLAAALDGQAVRR
ncbi:MAG: UDP-N-acetylmuramoyl-L-alanyl-D-glutamate--2,6-diaminopimelate ligase [Actinomycetales bacterium]